MAQPERLGREMREGSALEIRCAHCGHIAQLPRKAALEHFGDGAMVTQVRRSARCPACGRGDCLVGVIDTASPGAPPAPSSAPFPVERITFAVCAAARWSVYGACDPCRVLKALYAPTVNVPPKAPNRTIYRAFQNKKLVCSQCRTPFSQVTISQASPARDIARWSLAG